MAIYMGAFIEKGMEFMFIIDPNRYRCTIWKQKYKDSEFYGKHVKTMVDKDLDELEERLREWINKLPEGVC